MFSAQHSRRMWLSVAEMMNSQGDGAVKDWKGWAKYWVDYKAKLKRRVLSIKSSGSRTGGGPLREASLSEIEKKFLNFINEDFDSDQPVVSEDSFHQTLHEETSDISPEILYHPRQMGLAGPAQPIERRLHCEIRQFSQQSVRQTLLNISRQWAVAERRNSEIFERLLGVCTSIQETLQRIERRLPSLPENGEKEPRGQSSLE